MSVAVLLCRLSRLVCPSASDARDQGQGQRHHVRQEGPRRPRNVGACRAPGVSYVLDFSLLAFNVKPGFNCGLGQTGFQPAVEPGVQPTAG